MGRHPLLRRHFKSMDRKTELCGNASAHYQDLRRILNAERLGKRATDTLPDVIRRNKEQIDMRPDGDDKTNRLIANHGRPPD